MLESARKFLETVLDVVEERESGLLVWGVVDASFSGTELAQLIDPLIDRALHEGWQDYFDASAVIAELVNVKWLVESEGPAGDTCYRSRMAETVRLLHRLRQLFPKHGRTDFGWQNAATLVADFRFQRRRRQYPRRGVSIGDVLNHMRSATEDPSVLAGIRALLESSSMLNENGLAQFQVRSAQRILRAIETDKPLATIVCAGTGSGKTLAFYLPALASIVRHHIKEPSHPAWVKAVAIYPRSELLKDQLHEVLGRLIPFSEHLKANPKPSIRVGAFFGDTPRSAPVPGRKFIWPKSGRDYVCPMLRCLKCNGELRWIEQDFSRGIERLTCSIKECGFTIDSEIFPLTRESMAKRAPDILFSTTEMLNRRLSDNQFGHLFGVGRRALRAPELVLLDEVHTYDGRHGAQVAYLMRRWQHLVERPLRFVGLSATLRESTAFFSALTGIWQSSVEEIAPRGDELISEGAEYMIALRGDPVSRAALLSTTIQAAMLLERCLDPRTPHLGESLSGGLFGQRTFVFTDDLDVTNRLYFNLLDAEGRDSFGRPNMRSAPDGGLAYLRRIGMSRLRYLAGQDWRACESLNHQLSTRLVIDRVSSQDRGVNAAADIVVATAALEVGFDDPMVGAVIQHKAPRGMAGYLQRKGRAGRTRGMRPWMVVVLSDYGRDRNAYQNYDLLFDPELPVRTLPLSNRYITRMQAVYATIDCLGVRLQDAPSGSVWDDLSASPWNANRKARLIKEMRGILESDSGTRRLARYLRGALQMPEDEITALLWEYPRPLITTALPTALRRLETDWRAHGEVGQDFQVRYNPLPDFIPGSLFADLNLAEVAIELPAAPNGTGGDEWTMPLIAALREFAPGRVSRRFGVRYGTERYWLPPAHDIPASDTQSELDLNDIGRMVKVGDFVLQGSGQASQIQVYRPVSIAPKRPPGNINDTSNARLVWHTQLVPLGVPDWLSPPSESVWNSVIGQIGFFLHAAQAPVEVRRFATGSAAEIGIGRERRRISVQFAKEGTHVALGAAFAADGVVFQVNLPERLHARNQENDPKWRALRTSRFVEEAWRGISLPTVASPFLREWLAQVQLTAITYEAISAQVSLEDAAEALVNGTGSIGLVDVLNVLLQSQVIDVEDEQVALGGEDRLRHDLEDLLHDPLIQANLRQASTRLWEPITDEWELWLRRTYQATLGCALLRALCDLCPSVDANDLVMDLDRGPPLEEKASAPATEIWITEQGPGGSGLIEEFMRRYAEDPRRFFSMVRAALEMGEFELIDHQFGRLLGVLSEPDKDSETRDVLQKMRSARGHAELGRLSKDLRVAMVREGFSPFHGFVVSVANRILRPGAGPATDAYLASALSRWDAEERRLGIEIDLRVLCYLLSQTAEIDAVVSEVGIPEGTDLGAWRMSAISGLLWGRGRAIRQAPLQIRHPYVELPQIERLLVIESISDDRSRVCVDEIDWLDTASQLLAGGHLVTLTCSENGRERLSRALDALICNPVETGYFRAYARLQGIRQRGKAIEADIELVEAMQ